MCFYVCLHFCTGKYHDLERQLIQEFTAAQRRGEIGRMREVAAVLLHFKVTKKKYINCPHFLSTFDILFNFEYDK